MSAEILWFTFVGGDDGQQISNVANADAKVVTTLRPWSVNNHKTTEEEPTSAYATLGAASERRGRRTHLGLC